MTRLVRGQFAGDHVKRPHHENAQLSGGQHAPRLADANGDRCLFTLENASNGTIGTEQHDDRTLPHRKTDIAQRGLAA